MWSFSEVYHTYVHMYSPFSLLYNIIYSMCICVHIRTYMYMYRIYIIMDIRTYLRMYTCKIIRTYVCIIYVLFIKHVLCIVNAHLHGLFIVFR